MRSRISLAAVVAAILCLAWFPAGGALAQTATKDAVNSLAEARDIVLELPEVKDWQADRRKAAEADPKAPATGGILTGTRTPQGKKHWSVTFYKNPSTQPEKWTTFLVRARDGKVFVEGDGGKPVELELWRRSLPKPAS